MHHGARPTLAAVFLCLTAAAWPRASLGDGHPLLSLPDSRLGIRTAPLLLLSRADLRADVGLDARQTAEVERAIADLYARAVAVRGKTGPEAIAARKAIDEAQRRWLDAHLSEAQRIRLIQIDLQWEGPSALISRPVIADALFLTREQREALGRAVAECQRKRAAGTFQRSDEYQLTKQALAILNEEQHIRWKAMLGNRMRLASQLAGKADERPR
jgi:hypothetical protein